jgi:hypothetical protein
MCPFVYSNERHTTPSSKRGASFDYICVTSSLDARYQTWHRGNVIANLRGGNKYCNIYIQTV